MKVKVDEFECKRCGHVWISRVDNPVQCPGCKNTLWNEERKEKTQ